MRIAVFGADGYLGFPLSLCLLGRGHEVIAVDNGVTARRAACTGAPSVPADPGPLEQRLGGTGATVVEADVRDQERVRQLLQDVDVVVHLAQQRSAPYSMLSPEHALETVSDNLDSTMAVLFACRETGTRLVKLGSMGEYGTPSVPIPEGEWTLELGGRTARLWFPRSPGSFYHASKVCDSVYLRFACQCYGLTCIDVQQGPVVGVNTAELRERNACTRVYYDDVWGTVVHRFCAQASAGHPLTVYGRGGQTRGFLSLADSTWATATACEQIMDLPAGAYMEINQIAWTRSVRQLAEEVAALARERGCPAALSHVPNPREGCELEEHFYEVEAAVLRNWGLVAEQPQQVLGETLDYMLAHSRELRASVLAPRHTFRDGGDTCRDGHG